MVAQLGQTTNPKDLIPGEPELITGDLRALVKTLRQVVGVGNDLGRIDPGGWSGDASAAFRAAFSTEPPKWLRAGDELGGGGGALADYGDALVKSQAEAQQAIEMHMQAQAATRVAAAQYDAQMLAGTATEPFNDPGQAAAQAAQEKLDHARRNLAAIASAVVVKLGFETNKDGGFKKKLDKKHKWGSERRPKDENGDDPGGWVKNKGGKSWKGETGSESDDLFTNVLGELLSGLGADLHEHEWLSKNPHAEVWQGEKHGEFDKGPFTGNGKIEGSALGAGAGIHASGNMMGVTVGASAEAYLFKGSAEGEVKVGQHVGASGSGEVFVGAEAKADGTVGWLGAKGNAEAFAGARAKGNAGAEVAGIGAGVNGEAWAGAGAEASGQFGMGEDGKFHIGASAGVALGVGGKIGFDVTVDPAEVADTVVDVANDVGEVAKDVGRGVENVGHKIGKLFGR
jgi:hypothetical protein